jgi:hypothetical protein
MTYESDRLAEGRIEGSGSGSPPFWSFDRSRSAWSRRWSYGGGRPIVSGDGSTSAPLAGDPPEGVFQIVAGEIDHPEEKPELRPLPLTGPRLRR